MTSFDYTRMRMTADRLIERFGKLVPFTRTTGPGAYVKRDVRCLEVGRVKSAMGDSGVQVGDVRLLVESTGDPQQGDRIDLQGESMALIDPVTPIRPGAEVLAFECYARPA